MQPSVKGNPKKPRSQRAQYVNQACDECKRRKTRCDGMQPCGRCASLSASCTYEGHQLARTPRAVRQTVGGMPAPTPNKRLKASAQESLGPFPCDGGSESQHDLSGKSSNTTSDHNQASQPSTRCVSKATEFCGPSSSEFTLNVVNGNLQALGIPAVILENTSSSSSSLAHYGPFMKLLTMDPLWDFERDDAIGLINGWCDGVGSLYPVVSRDGMLETANNVFKALDHAKQHGLKSKSTSVAETLFTSETNKMKIVLAIGRTLEGTGGNDQAQRLFQSTTEAVEGLIWNSDGIDGIQLLVLVAIYHYHMDDEARAGRIIGFAARLCLEMGLHRRETIEKTLPTLDEQSRALWTFWSVYMFERRTSLGQGIPFSILDSHIDPSLFALDTSSAVLSATLEWTKLAGKTWQILNAQGDKGAEIRQDDLNYLDYQINQWYDRLPARFKLKRDKLSNGSDAGDFSFHRAVFFVRKSHLRNLAYRPILHSALRINQNQQDALTACEIAQDSIQTLSDLNEHGTHIRTHAVFFKHLLLTAFGNLLLAVVNAPYLFWDRVRAEFDVALRLIQVLSTKSGPLLRLWQRLQGLQELQAKLFRPSATTLRPEHNDLQMSPVTAQTLSFDALPPAHQADIGVSRNSHALDVQVEDSEVMEQVNMWFEPSTGLEAFFDFPFGEWGHLT